MTTIFLMRTVLLSGFFLATLPAAIHAQEVSIPDPGLNASIREALGKPGGPLTTADMLTLTTLNARARNVSSIVGLETAHNLVSLDLQFNHLSNVSLLSALTNLGTLDLSGNSLTNFSLPNGLTNLLSLTIEAAGLTNLTLPAGLTRLNNLDLENNSLTSFNQLSNLTGLIALDLGFNAFTNFSVPGVLTNLSSFYFAGNPLTSVTVLPGLSAMTELNLSQNLLTKFALPPGMTNLSELDLFFNQLTNVTLPTDLRNLTDLDLDFNRLSSPNFLSKLPRLGFLHLRANQFTNFTLPAGLTALNYLDVSKNPLTSVTLPPSLIHLTTLRLSENQLSSFALPVGLTNLAFINLSDNRLTNIVLPPDLGQLQTLNVGGNQLSSLNLPSGLTNLAGLFFVGNLLTNVTLPPDMTQLIGLGFLANPLTTFVLSESLAATNLAGDVAALQNQGVAVFVYPLTIRLVRALASTGAMRFGITGPPGVYNVLGSTNLTIWNPVGAIGNPLGGILFLDVTSSPRKFYRAVLQPSPTNMMFIPGSTFVMGSPTNEVGHQPAESPQTTVTLTHGFWIGRHEVTQGEYTAVAGSNPSQFPGDPNRPVESVSWPEATNYCALLTAIHLAAGLIPTGSQYRLPTEAEWECAARAGTPTRFSYGNDPTGTELANYAWYSANSGAMPHPVEQKAPNPAGLYDMEGNVYEWCLDWQGPYPGGFVTDPQGPASNATGVKIIRGGAWDESENNCRSAKRNAFGVHPFLKDFILGFRVVLTTPSS
jgi:formylglycine-generating enzyme required for sulfatase activity